MGHLYFLMDLRKPTPEIAKSGEPLPDLPGLTRRKNQQQVDQKELKDEYNRTLNEVRDAAKKQKSAKGAKKKKEKTQAMKATCAHMEDLLTKIGTYTSDEKMSGFKEDGDGF